MPAEQRVITIGFVGIGAAVLVVLYVLFGRGETVTGTLETINGDLFPRFERSLKDGNYQDARKAAKELVDALEKGGRATIVKNLAVEATERDRDAQRLSRMVEDEVFDRAAKGEFLFEGKFYPENVHRALRDLLKLVEGEFKTLERARRVSERMLDALEPVRTGSGKPVEVPAAMDVTKKVPGLDNDPLLAHDAKLFAVLALDAGALNEALATENPGGRATTFRLRWNQNVASGTIARDLRGLQVELRNLRELATRFRVSAEIVEEYPEGPAAAQKIYAKAFNKIITQIPSDVRKLVDEQRSAYERGPAIAAILKAEAELLAPGEANIEAISEAFETKFAEDG